MSLAQGNNTPTRPRIEPGSPDPESDALTIRPVRPPVNEWKIMFDPSMIIINKVPQYAWKTLSITLTLGFQTEGDTPGFQIFFMDLDLVCLMLNVPVKNFSVMLGLSHSFLGITSTFWG